MCFPHGGYFIRLIPYSFIHLVSKLSLTFCPLYAAANYFLIILSSTAI